MPATLAWSNPDRVLIVRDMAHSGASAARIARAIGVSRNAVVSKCRREGITLKGSDIWGEGGAEALAASRDDIANMYHGGMTYGAIAEALGLTRHAVADRMAVWRRLNGVKVTKTHQAWSRDEDKMIVDGVEAGKSFLDIAKEIGRSYRATTCRASELRTKGTLDAASASHNDQDRLRYELRASETLLLRAVAMAIRRGEHLPADCPQRCPLLSARPANCDRSTVSAGV